MSLYEDLKRKYNLSEKYPVLPFEQEKELIKKYQSKFCSNDEKQRIVEFFWNANKARIVQQAIKIYSGLVKSFHGDMSITIEDLIQKGFRAIPHCLDIYHKCEKRKGETTKQFKIRKSKVEDTRFGTLLQWWIRPYMTQHINNENFSIYVPHSKFTEKKSVSVDSLDSFKFDNKNKTKADYIPDDSLTPDQIANKKFFWESVKSCLTAEEYDFLIHWMFLSQYFKYKKEFYDYYKISNIKAKNKLNAIYAKLKPVLKGWKN